MGGEAIKNKRILVTGGAGFIGTSLARRLVGSNTLTLLDVGFDRNAFAFSELRADTRVKLAEVDILDMSQLARVAEDAQIVVHAAAVVGVREVVENASRTLDVNYIGTSNLLKILSAGSSCERVVLLSSSEVLGANAFRTPEDGDCVLPSIRDPRWCYSISKLATEHLASAYFREKGLPVVVVRPFNVFGPGRVGDHAVLRFILRALRSQDLEISGDGTQIRSWCYVDDFCDGLLRCLEVEEAIGRAFNIGNPRNAVTVYELAKKTVSACGSRSDIVFKSPPFRDIDVRVPEIALARDVLGFAPRVELEDGLARTIAWVKRHADVLGPSWAA
jgi:nucleoside-diphosphate-sugar epimerase